MPETFFHFVLPVFSQTLPGLFSNYVSKSIGEQCNVLLSNNSKVLYIGPCMNNGDIELKYRGIEPPLCWERVFGNTDPVEIEIGFGKCGFLIDIATDRSSVNFAGLEVSRKYYRKGIKKIQRAEIKNVKLLWGEAFHIFKRYVPEASVANMYINFPDPWPKKRHAKRRLLNAGFVEVAAQKLIPEGCLEIATDVKAYMGEALDTLQVNEHYVRLYYTTSEKLDHQRPYLSEYEKEFLAEGKTLYYAKYQRK